MCVCAKLCVSVCMFVCVCMCVCVCVCVCVLKWLLFACTHTPHTHTHSQLTTDRDTYKKKYTRAKRYFAEHKIGGSGNHGNPALERQLEELRLELYERKESTNLVRMCVVFLCFFVVFTNFQSLERESVLYVCQTPKNSKTFHSPIKLLFDVLNVSCVVIFNGECVFIPSGLVVFQFVIKSSFVWQLLFFMVVHDFKQRGLCNG